MKNDNDKGHTIEKTDETTTFTQGYSKDDHASVTGRPNIDEISKRNEEDAKLERKSIYKKVGIVVLFIIVAVVLIYFFS